MMDVSLPNPDNAPAPRPRAHPGLRLAGATTGVMAGGFMLTEGIFHVYGGLGSSIALLLSGLVLTSVAAIIGGVAFSDWERRRPS